MTDTWSGPQACFTSNLDTPVAEEYRAVLAALPSNWTGRVVLHVTDGRVTKREEHRTVDLANTEERVIEHAG